MEEIIGLTQLDLPFLLASLFIILTGAKALLSVLEWMVNLLGLETKWMRKRREEYNLIMQTSQSLAALQEKHEKDMARSDRRDEEISENIKRLTHLFIDKEIGDMRWEINNFAARISEGSPCNKDSFQHCIHIYEKYEKILEENGLGNGEVELSMELINNTYKQKLINGFGSVK